jgi:hypothetical protein
MVSATIKSDVIGDFQEPWGAICFVVIVPSFCCCTDCGAATHSELLLLIGP